MTMGRGKKKLSRCYQSASKNSWVEGTVRIRGGLGGQLQHNDHPINVFRFLKMISPPS